MRKIGESQSAKMPNGRGEKGNRELFEGSKFRNIFGFSLPKEIDHAAHEAVQAALVAMDKDAEGWQRFEFALNSELIESSRQGEVGTAYAAKRVFYEEACKRRKCAYNRLYHAAKLAARLGFSEPSIACAREIWHQEEERRTKQQNEAAAVA